MERIRGSILELNLLIDDCASMRAAGIRRFLGA